MTWYVYLSLDSWQREEPAHELQLGTVNITPGGALTVLDDDNVSHWYAPTAWYYATDSVEE